MLSPGVFFIHLSIGCPVAELEPAALVRCICGTAGDLIRLSQAVAWSIEPTGEQERKPKTEGRRSRHRSRSRQEMQKRPLVLPCQKWHNTSMDAQGKPLFWVGPSLDDLREFPEGVRRVMGFALRRAQDGGKHISAKPLRGFGGSGVLEIVEEDDGSAYRAVYTVKFAGAVYVLHAFQKKSTKGVATPKREIDLIGERLRRAEEHYSGWHEKGCGHE